MKEFFNSGKKSKPLNGLVGVLIIMPLLFWPQPESNSQAVPITHVTPSTDIIDSVAILRQINDRKESTSLIEAHKLVVLTNELNSKPIHHKVQQRETVISRPNVVIRYEGEIYETDPEYYKSYLIIDMDRFMAEHRKETIDITIIDTTIEPAKKRNIFKQFLHLFSNKHNESK